MNTPAKKVPLGLARVRKELPPPSRALKDKHEESRKHAKETLRHEQKQSRKP